MEVKEGRFREDLYYRLNVFPITVAPLRERRDDISALAGHFLERAARRLGRPVPSLTRGTCDALESYDWPGNVRELENVLERSLITSPGERLDLQLPNAARSSARALPEASKRILNEADVRRLERDNLIAALEHCRWKIGGKGGAAQLLGLRPTTLASRMRKLEIERPV